MTIRSANDVVRKAPKITNLVLNRETLHELTETEVETVAGGQVFRPRKPLTYYCSNTCSRLCNGWSWVRTCTDTCASSL